MRADVKCGDGAGEELRHTLSRTMTRLRMLVHSSMMLIGKVEIVRGQTAIAMKQRQEAHLLLIPLRLSTFMTNFMLLGAS